MVKVLQSNNAARPRADRSISTVLIVLLNSTILLTLQQLLQFASTSTASIPSASTSGTVAVDSPIHLATSSLASPFGLVIPHGSATPLPSVPATSDEEATIDRTIYGGKGDKVHLGGFTSFDPSGVSPTLWSHMVNHLGIKSLLDLGCGRGISTSWFVTHGLEYVVCAEGSHDAVTQSILPTISNIPNGTKYELIEHDFSRGPWWPSRTVDAAWCVEFTEHVGRNFMQNYHTAFRKAALIFATHSNWGGWHHVEVHDDAWWQVKMESMGFIYSDILTKEMRKKAQTDSNRRDLVEDMKTQNRTQYAVAQHLWTSLQVFINPLVASLPDHQHLFAEHGCFGRAKGMECEEGGNNTPLPKSFKPLPLTKEMDNQWMDLIKDLPLP
mmetsp:Transcript_32032/g.67341  ORF Transcript_32032/g.67341 Transcript_32032/m.67341 type:complete len:383 (-) Transcript_32032:206-1354(-)|eukprot:CAMPEP_0172325596 /NCGR_PEP_ID=MMETSP1058-20130122/54450_1 /TAXON_ID=83371 /ORGANISM="Detonula confervacea, Strain CCMP 353" /LENGTH=382 /DNA_ID=CAMNT_0013042185 /DNA_START=179 /DNA_END=1327 /DNA_ORIENTATION=-